MGKKMNRDMGKTNLVILLIVAGIAAVFMYQYIHPQESLGSRETLSQQEVKEVLLLESINKNITISQRELQNAYLGLLNKSNMTPEAYDIYVSERHGDKEAFMKYLGDNLQVLKLINTQVNWSQISIDEQKINDYIAANPSIFPQAQLQDPNFKEAFYSLARKQMFERQKQQLIDAYVQTVIAKHN